MVTDEMKRRAKVAYWLDGARGVESVPAVLEAALADVPEPDEWMRLADEHMEAKNEATARVRELEEEREHAGLRLRVRDDRIAELERQLAKVPEPNEIVICSAIRLSDGRVFRGHRHHDSMRTASALVEYQEPGSWDAKHRRCEQGFITSRNRYVDREEGLALQKAAGIESACRSGYRARELFSEDLY